MQITRPPILDDLNHALAKYGHVANCVLALPDGGTNFSRLSASPTVLHRSYTALTRELGATGIAIPRKYVVTGDDVVGYAAGAGYVGDETNPNPSGMGTAQQHHQRGTNLALGTTFADAPAAAIVHVPTGLTATASGIGHLLAKGTVSQTMYLLGQQVQALGYMFRTRDVWGILSPGARHGFLINDNMINVKFRGLPAELLDDKKIIKRNYAGGTADKPHSLDLALLFKQLWEKAGVSGQRLGFDERNTLTAVDGQGRLALPSKQAVLARGEQYAAGILAIVAKTA